MVCLAGFVLRQSEDIQERLEGICFIFFYLTVISKSLKIRELMLCSFEGSRGIKDPTKKIFLCPVPSFVDLATLIGVRSGIPCLILRSYSDREITSSKQTTVMVKTGPACGVPEVAVQGW